MGSDTSTQCNYVQPLHADASNHANSDFESNFNASTTRANTNVQPLHADASNYANSDSESKYNAPNASTTRANTNVQPLHVHASNYADPDSESKTDPIEVGLWMHTRHKTNKKFLVCNERKYVRDTRQAKSHSDNGLTRYKCSSKNCRAQLLVDETSGRCFYNDLARSPEGQRNIHDSTVKHETWDQLRKELHTSQSQLLLQMQLNPDRALRSVFYDKCGENDREAAQYASYGGKRGVKWLLNSARSKGIRTPKNKTDLIAMLDEEGSVYAKTSYAAQLEKDRELLAELREKMSNGFEFKFDSYSLKDVPQTAEEWDRMLEHSASEMLKHRDFVDAVSAGRREFFRQSENEEEMNSPELDLWLGAASAKTNVSPESSLVFATKKSCQVRQFVIFVSTLNVRIFEQRLARSMYWLFDASFDWVCKTGREFPFAQCWVIHAIEAESLESARAIAEQRFDHKFESMPCAFILMSRQELKRGDYAAALRKLVQQAQQKWGIDLTQHSDLRTAMSDFENPERGAIEDVLGIKDFRACAFHFCQACVRNIGEHGLTDPYRDTLDPTFREYVRRYMMLMFLPEDLVIRALNILLAQYRDKTPDGYHKEMRGWLTYFIETWIITPRRERRVCTWNQYRNPYRTNNRAERWNRQANAKLGKHPSWHKFWTVMNEMFTEGDSRAVQLRTWGQANPMSVQSDQCNRALFVAWDGLDGLRKTQSQTLSDNGIMYFLDATNQAMKHNYYVYGEYLRRWMAAEAVARQRDAAQSAESAAVQNTVNSE